KSLYALSCSSVEPLYGSSNRINCLTCDVIFCGSSAIASRAEYAPGPCLIVESIYCDRLPSGANGEERIKVILRNP
ncbi:hypothetical protein Tco_0137429, partial [Tanacetum coccineum]